MSETADAFSNLYRRVEHALKRCDDFRRKDRKKADADWKAFAVSLGEDFFNQMRASNSATTLIDEPPRILMRDLTWAPQQPAKIESIVDLFERGVCQVRHNHLHGEKMVGSEEDRKRDEILMAQATNVLAKALEKAPKVQEQLPKD